jgi:predicted ATPase with chaperone activity
MTDIINLSDAELQRRYRDAVDELASRCPLTDIDAADIKGQESPKRALAVAAMEQSPIIRAIHIMEAVNYRFPFF